MTHAATSILFQFFRWRSQTALAQKIILAFAMATLTGLAAQIHIPLWFTPVPITGQTFAVLLSGIILGRNWGGISQIIYVSLGAIGLPWFGGATAGLAILSGPTGGYIIGFILAAFFLGHMVDQHVSSRRFFNLLGLMLFAHLFCIFLPGLIQLGMWLSFVKSDSFSIHRILQLGFYPFVIGLVVKTILAAGIASSLLPKIKYSKSEE
jgi:biotin transport system substrate-specific component